jgi:hypothetical protein
VSYRSGFKAFVQRFHNRFPEPEYRYVLLNQQASNRPITVVVSNAQWSSLIGGGGDLQTIRIHHRQSDELVSKIICDLTFGIKLQVESRYLSRPFLLFKRPKDLQKTYRRRLFLEGKPKFAKLGASLSSQIHFNFADMCSTCAVAIGYRERLCFYCYQDHLDIINMVNEGGRL